MSVFHRWIKRRSLPEPSAADYIVQKSDFGIRLADFDSRIDQVEMLVTRMYRQRGYHVGVGPSNPDARSDASLRRATLEARRANRTVGAVTVNLDGPGGLMAEDLYRSEIAPYRDNVNRLCEFTQLALDIEECGKEALGNLFHLAFIVAYRIQRATDLFIEVNPRHALFYRRKLGLEQIGELKICRRVQAPAVLLHQKLAHISEQIIRYGGLKLPCNRTFYSFFMAPWEERELVNQIGGMLRKTRLQADSDIESAAA
jgi:hypothetical protein